MRISSIVRSLIPLVVMAVMLGACGSGADAEPEVELPDPIDRDWSAIVERDTLFALMASNSTSYFLYRGLPLGFEYELLTQFAEENDLHLAVRVVQNLDSMMVLLNQGVGDVAAARLVPGGLADTSEVFYTSPLYTTPPVLVQRSSPLLASPDIPSAVDTVLTDPPSDLDEEVEEAIADEQLRAPEDAPTELLVRARLVRKPSQLGGQEVNLRDESPYERTLIELSDTITGDIHVVELEDTSAEEQVIEMVAQGEVDYTVAPENLARLTETSFENLRVSPLIGDPHEVAWATRINADTLARKLDAWIAEKRGGGFMNALYKKYYVDRKSYRERVESEYLSSETGVLSDYDDLFKKGAVDLGWDWRLLASQSYQESRFKPRARSWAGAMGLLQLMPPTARQFGVTDAWDPEQNVEGAVRFLEWLQGFWEDDIPDERERLKFILASYNAGPGHVQDARRLTEKYGGDDTVWDDVAWWMLKKSEAKYYRDPVVKHGFVRGMEPVTYVALILDRFDHYRQFVRSPGLPAPADSTAAADEAPAD